MWLLDLIMDIIGLLLDILHARRYGWGSFMWDLATWGCAIVTIVLFYAGLYVLGTLGIIASVACLVAGFRRFKHDVKSKREYEACKNERDNKKEN